MKEIKIIKPKVIGKGKCHHCGREIIFKRSIKGSRFYHCSFCSETRFFHGTLEPCPHINILKRKMAKSGFETAWCGECRQKFFNKGGAWM